MVMYCADAMYSEKYCIRKIMLTIYSGIIIKLLWYSPPPYLTITNLPL